MSKLATKAADNVFYKARMAAAKWNDKLSSREGAAEVTGLDRTRIAYIELGTINPYPEEILILADCYNAPELCNHYCARMCPLGRQTVEPVEVKELEAVTLQLLSSIRTLPAITDELVDIVEDGQIDEDEREGMENILKQLKRAAGKIKALELVYEKRLRTQEEDRDVFLKSKVVTGYFRVYSIEIEGDTDGSVWQCKARLLEVSG